MNSKRSQVCFKLTSKIGTYVYSVSRFLWKDQQAKSNKTQQIELPASLTTNEQNELELFLQKEEKLKAISAVLNEISIKCQQIFELFYFKKLSMKAIAQQMKYTSERVARTQKYKCIEQAKKKVVI